MVSCVSHAGRGTAVGQKRRGTVGLKRRLLPADQIKVIPHCLRQEVIRDHADIIVRPQDDKKGFLPAEYLGNVGIQRDDRAVDKSVPFRH